MADGVVITPSHNPPDNGGFKYNPPNGGPADTDVTSWIADRANELLAEENMGVKCDYYKDAFEKATTVLYDYITPYVADLENVIDMEAISKKLFLTAIFSMVESLSGLTEKITVTNGVVETMLLPGSKRMILDT